MGWKSGKDNPKSVVITDFGISILETSMRFVTKANKNSMGTAGWTSPEQWPGDCMKESYDQGSTHRLVVMGSQDAFSFGRLMIYMFSDWNFAWKLTFYPMEQVQRYIESIKNKGLIQINETEIKRWMFNENPMFEVYKTLADIFKVPLNDTQYDLKLFKILKEIITQ